MPGLLTSWWGRWPPACAGRPGDFVVGGFNPSDNTCPVCRKGAQANCLHDAHYDGAQAERIRIPWADGTLVAVPGTPEEDLIPSLLALSDVMCTGWHAALSAGVGPGDSVAVMRRLGHERFVAHGTDFGSAVATWAALDHPDAVAGLHLSNVDLSPSVGADALSDEEHDYLESFDAWWSGKRGYKEIQSTRPDALTPGLSDSPAGLAAWVLDRWHQWTDPSAGEHLVERGGPDAIGDTLTWLWTTNSIATSVRDYLDNRTAGTTALPAGRRVQVPTAVPRFARMQDFVEDPPRTWLERMFHLVRHMEMPHGGHFAALEAPDLLAEDLLAFTSSLDQG